jgi:hypothetical protein
MATCGGTKSLTAITAAKPLAVSQQQPALAINRKLFEVEKGQAGKKCSL